jgi:DnaJ-domain-containing protein 1
VNKSGGPDLRFNDNRQIPIYRYGQIFMTCGDWQLNVCLSRADAASQFAAALRTALKEERGEEARRDSREVPPRPKTEPDSPLTAFRRLGLEPGASFDEVSAAYRRLAAQNHPDKVAQMAPEFRELAERKMRELNAAYDQIRLWYQQRR